MGSPKAGLIALPLDRVSYYPNTVAAKAPGESRLDKLTREGSLDNRMKSVINPNNTNRSCILTQEKKVFQVVGQDTERSFGFIPIKPAPEYSEQPA